MWSHREFAVKSPSERMDLTMWRYMLARRLLRLPFLAMAESAVAHHYQRQGSPAHPAVIPAPSRDSPKGAP